MTAPAEGRPEATGLPPAVSKLAAAALGFERADGDISVPEGILSASEFDAWATERHYGNGKRGTYRNENSFLYVKHCLRVEREEDVVPALAMARHLTAAGIIHPDTKWGVFSRSPTNYQLVPVAPKLHAWSLSEHLKEPERSPDLKLNINDPDSILVEWCRRVDPDFQPEQVDKLHHSVASGDSLGRVLNFYEASHPDNWGQDIATNIWYPVDVEVIRLGANIDFINQWYGKQQ